MVIRRHVLDCAAALFALFAMSKEAAAGGVCGDSKPVKIVNAQIRIEGIARAGIPVKVGTDPEILIDAITDDWTGAQGVTDAAGKVSINTCYWGLNNNPPLIFRFRTDWNGDSQVVYAALDPAAPGTLKYTGDVNFTGAGAKGFVPLRPESKVKLRFPVSDPMLINNFDYKDIAKELDDLIYSGPVHNDHKAPKGSPGSPTCVNYRGQGGIFGAPYCYGSHEGTDYMLLGGFTQMDQPSVNLIVAAADGIVEEILDTNYDRCHTDYLAPSTEYRPGKISCNSQMKQTDRENHVYIRHDFDHPNDGAYQVRTAYLHIKKGSASSRIKVNQFVPCGTVIAEIGSSGVSAAPHLHFEVRHKTTEENQWWADPYQGRLSTRGYWVNQNGGPERRGFPLSQCQSALERYGPNYGTFSADLTVTAPQDLGIQPVMSPGTGQPTNQLRRFWKVTASVPKSSLKGFNLELTTVKYTFPTTAAVQVNASKVNEETIFYMPIAGAAYPALSQYTFDVLAEVEQINGIRTPVKRYLSARVNIPRPQVNLVASGHAVGASRTCPMRRAYTVNLTATATGLSGTPVTSWLTTTTTGRNLTTAPKPLTLCGGESATTTVTMTDASGVESVSKSMSFSTPTFVAPIVTALSPGAPVNTFAIPSTSALGSTGEKTATVYGALRVVVKPAEAGGTGFPLVAPRVPLSIVWKDLGYRDLAAGAWMPIPREEGRSAPPAKGRLEKPTGVRQKVSYRMDKTLFDNDTVVVTFADLSWPTEFGASVTVTDPDRRVASDIFLGANGYFPASEDLKDRLRRGRFRDFFFASGFRYDGMYRAESLTPILRRPGDPSPPDALAALVRANTLMNRADKVALTRFNTDVVAFGRQLQRARLTKTLPSMSARSMPKFTVAPTRMGDNPALRSLLKMNAASRATARPDLRAPPQLLKGLPARAGLKLAPAPGTRASFPSPTPQPDMKPPR
jgi:hypothetical protein